MTDSYTYLLIKAILTLVFVLGLLGVSFYALKSYMAKGGKKGQNRFANPVKVITTSFLGQKKNIAIVEVAGEMLVLGITPTSITFLTRIERGEAIEELKKLESSRSKNFLSIFQNGI
ncbi:MAG: flagellar biosynthetic protein FliO [Deltaproteobacteria bacterium]|nr:flagellar biosynthetic protein FliO [Deltaproteobacteria bacterium]